MVRVTDAAERSRHNRLIGLFIQGLCQYILLSWAQALWLHSVIPVCFRTLPKRMQLAIEVLGGITFIVLGAEKSGIRFPPPKKKPNQIQDFLEEEPVLGIERRALAMLIKRSPTELYS